MIGDFSWLSPVKDQKIRAEIRMEVTRKRCFVNDYGK
jgi:hypothetical protein